MIILNLINQHKWEKIFKNYISNKKYNLNKPIINKNYLIHYIGLNNKEHLFDEFINNNGDILKINSDGENIGHITAKLGYHKFLKKIVNHKPHILNKLDNKNNTILNLINHNAQLLKYFFNRYNKYINSINNITINKHTLLSQSVENNNYNIVKLLAQNNANLDYPTDNIPIILAINNNNLKMVKLLEKLGANINIKNINHTNGFITAVYNKNKDIVDFLIKKNVDQAYIGIDSDDNPILIALLNEKYDIVNLLLKKNININQHDKYLNIVAHYLFLLGNINIPINIKKIIIDKTENLNKQNIKGDTVMHYLIKNDDWKKYNDVLLGKNIDINIKNNNGLTIIDYLQENEKDEFNKFIYTNYIHILNTKKENWLYSLDYKCSKFIKNKNDLQFNKQCKNQIMTNINKQSYPIINNDDVKDILILHNNYAYNGLFATTTIFNVIYSLIIMKKYSGLTIPLIYNPLIKQIINTESDNLYRDPMGKIVKDSANIYSDIMLELANFVIIWYNKNCFYIPNDLEEAIFRMAWKVEIRFIFIRLNIIVTENMGHANVLIYDKKENTIERFEPYGIIPYNDPDSMDNYLSTYFKKIINNDIKYLRPTDFMNRVSFQTIADENNELNKKIGDPGGYCLAWVYWYIEMRVINQNIKPHILVEKLISKINQSSVTFMEYIRNYANNLDKQKLIFFAQAGINEKNWYNEIYNNDDLVLMINHINNILK